MAPAVRFRGITKRFPGVVALHDVGFEVGAGSCHAVCGENGAGKSTLGRLLAGIDVADEGSIEIDGAQVRFADPGEALAAGVAMVHQELAFCENMTVSENLSLGAMPSRGPFVDWRAMRARCGELLGAVGADLDPDRPMHTLCVAEQQLVQIAGAVASGARIVVFDEPTSSLTGPEAERLYALVGRLVVAGVTVLYVSHRMPEIFRLCDHVTVLRDGEHVATRPIGELDESTLVRLMIGRTVEQYFPSHAGAAPGDELLRVDDLTCDGCFDGITFSLRAGEVLGLAGLVGAGRSEVAQAIFGLRPVTRGRVQVRGLPARIRSPRDAMALGVGFVPEDRKHQGLVLSMLARQNVTLPILPRLSRRTWIRRDDESALARRYLDRLGVRSSGDDVAASALSGGNQQKLVLARWLAAESRVLILDEPTRGVDVGAKAELHAWIDALAADGHAVLLISSELPELMSLCGRVVVFREGRLAGELPRDRVTQDALMRLMAGLEPAVTPAS